MKNPANRSYTTVDARNRDELYFVELIGVAGPKLELVSVRAIDRKGRLLEPDLQLPQLHVCAQSARDFRTIGEFRREGHWCNLCEVGIDCSRVQQAIVSMPDYALQFNLEEMLGLTNRLSVPDCHGAHDDVVQIAVELGRPKNALEFSTIPAQFAYALFALRARAKDEFLTVANSR